MPQTAAPYGTPHVLWRINSSGNFAMFAAIRRASSRVSNFAADLRPGSSSKYTYTSAWPLQILAFGLLLSLSERFLRGRTHESVGANS